MKRHLAWLIALPAIALASVPAAAASWIFRPSTYTHEPLTGARVNQYAAGKPALVPNDPTYLESGYRHNRVAIRGADGSADYLHVVQTWGLGEQIRPYGEWLYPYRAGATPYGPWGNPQGPWTLPFDSWMNPYGLGQLPHSPMPYWPYGSPGGYSPGGYPPGYPPYRPPRAYPPLATPYAPYAAPYEAPFTPYE